MLSLALAFILSPMPSLTADDVLPSDVTRAYAAAHGALRSGDDEAALARWAKARALFDALPPATRIDPAVRDAAVRRELWLAEQAKQRFDAIVVPKTLSEASDVFAAKQQLMLFLVGDPDALGNELKFEGAYRRVISLKPSLRGIHCQWADVLGRYERWLGQLPCSPDLSEEQCELFKKYQDDNGYFWHEEIGRQMAACRI